MSDFDVKKKRFEQDIEEYLITHVGYTKGNPKAFDHKLALDTAKELKRALADTEKILEEYAAM